MSTVSEVEHILKVRGNPEKKDKYQYFGIEAAHSVGLTNPEIKSLAKEFGKNHQLALQLIDNKYHEARFLAVHLAIPSQLTESVMDFWVEHLYSWDLVDNAAPLFQKTPFAHKKALEWVERDEEFIRRAGLVTLLYISMKDKKASNEFLSSFLEVAIRYSSDPRNFVKKAVSWLIRQIGKKNLQLNDTGIKVSTDLSQSDDPTARWIGKDCLRELSSEKVQERLYKKSQSKTGSL